MDPVTFYTDEMCVNVAKANLPALAKGWTIEQDRNASCVYLGDEKWKSFKITFNGDLK